MTWGASMDENNRVLVVDDDRSVADAVRNQLITYDYDVEVFYDAREALEHLQHEECPYDLLVLDINLPGLDGLTLAKRIRRMYSVPILFISGDITEDVALSIQAMGATAALLEKGFAAATLQERCLSLLGANQIYSQLGDLKRSFKDLMSRVELGTHSQERIQEIIQESLSAHCPGMSAQCQDRLTLIFDDRIKKKVTDAVTPESMAVTFQSSRLVKIILGLVAMILMGVMGVVKMNYTSGQANQEGLAQVRADYRASSRTLEQLQMVPQQIRQQSIDIQRLSENMQNLDTALKGLQAYANQHPGLTSSVGRP